MTDHPKKPRGRDRRGKPPRRTDDRIAQATHVRRERAHLSSLSVLVGVMCALAAVVGYGTLHTLPDLRAVQDSQVCAFRSVANRETRLARHGSPETRAAHRQSHDTFLTLAELTARGRDVRCRPLLDHATP